MKICILMGSPREDGNTAAFVRPFIEELEFLGAKVDYIVLHDKDINPCKYCNVCQNVSHSYGCSQQDDMLEIFNKLLESDCFIFATPIYSWFCTPPIKAVMDRLYGMNKYYGSIPKNCLWKGQKCAVISTCGYEVGFATELLDKAMKRGCEHSQLKYLGLVAARDIYGIKDFQTKEAVSLSKAFAQKIYLACNTTN